MFGEILFKCFLSKLFVVLLCVCLAPLGSVVGVCGGQGLGELGCVQVLPGCSFSIHVYVWENVGCEARLQLRNLL